MIRFTMHKEIAVDVNVDKLLWENKKYMSIFMTPAVNMSLGTLIDLRLINLYDYSVSPWRFLQ